MSVAALSLSPTTSTSRARRRRVVTWAGSIAAHAVVVGLVMRAGWVVVDTATEPRPTDVVWLTVRPEATAAANPAPRETATPGGADATASETEPAGPSVADTPDRAQTRAAEADDSTARIEPVPVAAEDSEAPEAPTPGDVEAPDPTQPDTPATSTAGRRAIITRRVDWDEEMRRAVAAVGEQIARDPGYPTFSLDDVAGPSPRDVEPRQDIFAAAAQGPGGPALLTPGRRDGPIGRGVTALCDVLGGVGLSFQGIGLGSVCAGPRPRYALFSELKPAYLRSRPECVEVPGAIAPTGLPPGTPVFKCRLVDSDAPPAAELAGASVEPSASGSGMPFSAESAPREAQGASAP